MSDEDWSGSDRCITVFLNGEGIPDLDARGQRVTDDSFLLVFNAHHEDVRVTLPGTGYGGQWAVVLDTDTGEVFAGSSGGVVTGVVAGGPLTTARTYQGDGDVTVTARSLVVLERTG